MSKTEAMWIGSKKGDVSKPFENKGIRWLNDKFKCLGVDISLNLDKLFKLNMLPKLDKIDRLIQIWHSRNLTLIGRITVIKSLLLPQLLYLFTVLPIHIPQSFFKKVESMFYKFIWNNKRDKVKREAMVCSYAEGGLDMVHVESFFKAQQNYWVKLLLDENHESVWKSIELDALKTFNDDPFLLFKCNPSRSTLNKIKYTSVISSIVSWNQYKNSRLNPRNQSLWYNINFRAGNTRKRDLHMKTWLEKGILYVEDIMVEDRLMNFEELAFLYDLPERDRRVFDHIENVLTNIDNIDNVQDVDHDESLTNSELLANIVFQKAPKYTYNFMAKARAKPPAVMLQKWEADMGETLTREAWEKINKNTYTSTIETKLKTFYFKFLHRILANNEFLSRVDIIESDLCTFCQENVETLYHYLCSCPLSIIFWTEVLTWIKTNTNIDIELIPAVLLFGRDVKSECIQYILLFAKYCIYLSRLRGQIPMFDVFLAQIKAQYNIEFKIAEENFTIHKLFEKWTFEPM